MRAKLMIEGDELSFVAIAETEAEQRMLGVLHEQDGLTATVQVENEGHVSNHRIKSARVIVRREHNGLRAITRADS